MWRVEFSKAGQKALRKLDHQTQIRILRFIDERLIPSSNPRSLGSFLSGDKYKNLIRYRVGDYRLIASIEDDRVLIIIVDIDHRSRIYG